MASVWLGLAGRLLAAALAGLVAGALFGSAAGVPAVAGALLLMLAAHTARLARLQRWLEAPAERDIPEAPGAWGKVFAELYRMLRREVRARTRVRAELDLLRLAAGALPDGIVLLDAAGHIVWCNATAERHLGIDAQRDAGLLLSNLVRRPRFAEFVADGERGRTFLHQPPHNPGQKLSLESIPFEEGRRLVVSCDITQIERAETMRRDFIANVSHELRTPLTVINGFLEHLAGEGAPAPAEAAPQLRLMEEQARRMLRLVDDLLVLSRLESADNPLREEEVDMPALLEAVLGEARGLSAGRHALSLEAAPGALRGAHEELRSAFSNLASNAVRYTPAGGRIALRWRVREDGRAEFSVADDGIGIAPEHIPRLTERFYRVDRGRSRDSGGTGLGLAIVKHVLLRHQAILEIRSTPGAGSTFSAVFPRWRLVAPSAS